MSEIRTRFAPSPTGYLHIGGARTALFSWAFARRHGGKFILRIEDTDQERSTKESVQAILDGMHWLGLDYDEGPVFQMSRLARYREVVDELIRSGHAYPCYSSREELDELREQQRAHGGKPRYDGRWRPENAQGKTPPAGVQPIIRFRNPDSGEVSWDDMVKGRITIANAELDDLVLMRADGVPTYNFGVVVDDLDMGMTHVIRGDDHVNNTPRQINIYKALGSEIPQFAHVPMILGADGERLSKRHGAVSVMQYPEDGFLPGALLNYLARLGWSHGDDEVFSMEQFVAWFDLAHASRSPAQFNGEKLTWLNQQYIKAAPDGELAVLVEGRLQAVGIDIPGGPQLASVVALYKDRVSSLTELADALHPFFIAPRPSEELATQHLTDAIRPVVQAFLQRAAEGPWDKASIARAMKETLSAHGLKMPQLAIPLRVLVLGQTQTPAIDAVLEVLGRDSVVARAATFLKG